MVDINYNKEEGILYWRISGDISRADLINSIDKIVALVEKDKPLSILHIEDNVSAKFSAIDNIKNSFYAKKYFFLYPSIRIAFVTENPKNMAFFILGINALTGSKLKSKVFSSISSAKYWLVYDEL